MSNSQIGAASRLRAPLPWASGVAASIAVGIAVTRLPFELVASLAAALLVAVVILGTTSARRRLLIVVGALVYIAAFHWVYVEWVVPLYGYSGLIDAGAELSSLAVVTFVAGLSAALLPVRLSRPSEVVLWFLYLFGYIPASIIPIYILGPDLWAVLPFGVLLLIGFVGLALMQRIPRSRSSWSGLSHRSFERLVLVLGLGSIAYLVVFFGIPTQVPDFVTAYEARADFGAIQSGVPGSGYLVTWAGNVIFPFLMTLGLTRPRLLLLVLGIVGEFLLYTQAGAKAVLFNILLVPMLYVAIRFMRDRFGVVLMWASVGILGISVVATAATGSLWPLALYAVRLISLPGELTAYYLDFFTSHTTYELSHSFLRWFVSAPYAVDPPQLIGAIYLHTAVNANANIWADALANFGLAGVVPFSILLGALLWVLDSVGAERDLLVIGPTLGIAGLSLANGALFTSILTYGIGLTIVLMTLMPKHGRDPLDEVGSARAP